MSLYQGVTQIRLWTGKDAPVEAMLLDILAEKKCMDVNLVTGNNFDVVENTK